MVPPSLSCSRLLYWIGLKLLEGNVGFVSARWTDFSADVNRKVQRVASVGCGSAGARFMRKHQNHNPKLCKLLTHICQVIAHPDPTTSHKKQACLQRAAKYLKERERQQNPSILLCLHSSRRANLLKGIKGLKFGLPVPFQSLTSYLWLAYR